MTISCRAISVHIIPFGGISGLSRWIPTINSNACVNGVLYIVKVVALDKNICSHGTANGIGFHILIVVVVNVDEPGEAHSWHSLVAVDKSIVMQGNVEIVLVAHFTIIGPD